MEDSDIAFINYIYQDLIYLHTGLNAIVKDDEIRRSSGILRSFLVEGKLQIAWKMMGFEKQPKIYSPYLDVALVEEIKPTFIQAGGAKTFGSYVENACVFQRVLSEEEIKKLHTKTKPNRKAFNLSDFIESFCIGHGCWLLSRKDIIEYVANKKGGVHFDDKRNRSNDECYKALDALPDTLKVGDRNPIMYELLSTAYFLTNSRDIIQLIKKIETVRKKS